MKRERIEGVAVSVLGRLQIDLNGAPLAEELPLKGQALLIYLMLLGHPASRTVLAGLLWGGMPEEVARTNLRLTLSRLRQTLRDYLLSTRQSVAFNFDLPHWLDVAEFQSVADDVAALSPMERGPSLSSLLDSLLALYRGDFLTDLPIPDAPEFDTWALTERERLRQVALHAVASLVEAARRQGNFAEGIRATRHLLSLEPWHEEGHRQLMWLLAASGQRSAALAQFEVCRRLLEEELAVEPDAETVSLYEQIRVGAITAESSTRSAVAPGTSPHNLPPQLTPFIGRKTEVAHLQEKLRDSRYRLLSIVGEGGIGKSRLALAAAEPLADHFPHGRWFVPLAGLAAPGVGRATVPESDAMENQIAIAAGSALGITFARSEEPRVQLINYLRHKNSLLILDNFEEFLAGAPLLLAILQAAPNVTLLVTSREPLNFQAEYLLRLEGMPVPEEGMVPSIDEYDSLKLFAERAERAVGQPFLSERLLPDVVQICRFVAGLPLGIELAASSMRHLTPRHVLDALEGRGAELATSMRDVAPRHRSLEAVFEYSWQLLTEAEQRSLTQLSGFYGRFTAEAAQQIADTTLHVLTALVDKSLVQQAAAGYFALHPLIRRFAADRLATLAIDHDSLRERHMAYYLSFMATQAKPLRGEAPRLALQGVQAEMDNVRQAWRWATEYTHLSHLDKALEGMAEYWEAMGLYLEGEHALREAIDEVQASLAARVRSNLDATKTLLSQLHGARAYLLYELTRYDAVIEAAREAIEWGRAAGSATAESVGYLRLGQALWGQGRYAGARAHFERAMHLAEEGDNLSLRATILRNLAAAVWRQGEHALARRYSLEARDLFRQQGERRNEAKATYMLGIIAQNESHFEEAREICEEVLHVAREAGDRRMELGAHSMLGLIVGRQGELDKALAHFEQELALAREMGAVWSQAVGLSNLGDLKGRAGDYEGARQCYEAALRLGREQNASPALESNVLAYLGLLSHFDGNHPEGAAYCRRALELARSTNVPREQGFAGLFLAHNLAAMEVWQEAEEAYRQAATIWESLGDEAHRLEAVAGLARVALAQENRDEARTQVERLLTHLHPDALEGADDPVAIYLTCYNVLRPFNGPQAQAILETGAHFLQRRAAKISDYALRHSFLHNVPSHRALRREVGSRA